MPQPSLAERPAPRIARGKTRSADCTVFGFETAKDSRCARIQRRCLGASDSTDPNDLRGGLPAITFTMSHPDRAGGQHDPHAPP